jgi:hypothetical protein
LERARLERIERRFYVGKTSAPTTAKSSACG